MLDGSTISISNKRRCLLSPVTNRRHPPQFWDNLSEIPLTSSALLEVERRNTQSSALLEVERSNTQQRAGLRRSSRLVAQQAAAPNQLLEQYASEQAVRVATWFALETKRLDPN
jgi:hypothetical protein